MRWWWLALALGAGCVKRPEVPRAPEPVAVALSASLVPADASEPVPVPEPVLRRIREELARRNLVATVVDAPADLSAGDRAAWVAERADGARAVVVVDARARFSVQVNGRYRWNVTGTVVLAPDGEAPRTAELSIPVALIYAHQDEDDALAEAAPLVARKVGVLVDRWLRSGS